MLETLIEDLELILLQPASMLLLYVFIFLFAKWFKGMTSPYNLDQELTEKDNVAMAVSTVGYFLGITAIFTGAMSGPSIGFFEDLLAVGGFSLGGVLALNLARVLNDKLILYRFSTLKEIVEDKNPGTGAVQGGAYVASGLIIAGSVHGEGGSIITAIVFFLLGQVALILFALLYEVLTPYDVHGEIEKDNTAAGLGFAGGLISIGIIVMKAVSGNFISWGENLSWLGLDILLILVYLVFVRLFFDKFILIKSDLNTEIAKDQNIGAGLLEMFVSISFSALLFFMMLS